MYVSFTLSDIRVEIRDEKTKKVKGVEFKPALCVYVSNEEDHDEAYILIDELKEALGLNG